MKYQAIAEESKNHSTQLLCRFFKVSKSGYYAWKTREVDETEELRVVRLIEKIHIGSRRNYGSPRIHQVLLGLGETVSEDKVARLMRKFSIKAKTKRKFRPITTQSQHNLPVAKNILNQDFTSQHPGEKLVGDITYIATQEGWLYLSCVLDLCTRKIVGWSMSDDKRACSRVA
jgi:transposase InsO family protein